MAAPLLFLLLLSFSLSSSLIQASSNSICSSHNFTNNKSFTQCTDLPHLSSSLHWTYDSSGSLSIAFIAPVSSPNGWIAWALNPKMDSMIGAQALIAFKQTDGSMAVKTYNIVSYESIKESPISYETSDLSAESGSDGDLRLFATIKIGTDVQSLNQIYQVGESVTNGVPDRHELKSDNLASKGIFNLGETLVPESAPGADSKSSSASDGLGEVTRSLSVLASFFVIFLVQFLMVV
ncbi:hypothetical protein LUZ60_015700 [Juncus effusus]|nr:hypothetical protein LUZ60_015700 [Juncus effusus]